MVKKVASASQRSTGSTASSLICWSLLSLLLLTILNLTNGVVDQSVLQTAKQWKVLTYNFPPKTNSNDENFYNPMNVLITGIAIGYDRIFVATPRLLSGVSATVSYVPKAGFGDSPVLQAYPDWSFTISGRTDFNCSDLILVSVYRMRIDSCNRLWILDAGVSRSLEDYEITCPPKILVVDLNTNQVVRRIDFPREVRRGETLFTNLIVDETTSKAGTCDDVFVYISDTVEPAIIVYDSERDVTWRVSHPAMYPDPDYSQSEILGHRFVLMDGIVGLTFDDKNGIVYFQPLATDRVFSVTREVLRAGPLPLNQILDVKLVGKKSSQGIGLAVSPIDGSLLFSPMSETAIASWSPSTNEQSVLAYDQDQLQFVADITTSRFDPGVVFAISSKFHRFFLKNLDVNEFNNRILRIQLPESSAKHRTSQYGAPTFLAKSQNAPPLPALNGFYNSHSAIQNPFQFYPGSTHSPSTSFFTQSRNAFGLEAYDVINHSIPSPLPGLNHGEAFISTQSKTPSLERSFLDHLPASVSARVVPLRGYHYRREKRSLQQQQQLPSVTTRN